MRYFVLLLGLFAVLLAGCQAEEETVFVPAMGSGESTPEEETVFVPAVGAEQAQGEATAVSPTATMMAAEPATAVPSGSGKADADVLFVEARATGENTWSFAVTVAHPDTGWENYADGWDVLLPDGTVIKPDRDSPFTRLLVHPHVDEQPFTRSQSGIVIPPDVQRVTVRAHDNVDGFGGREVVVDLTAESGPDFTVEK